MPIHACVISPISWTISEAAVGCPNWPAFRLIVARSSSSFSQHATSRAISSGSLQKSPKPASRTTSTFPASCPGKKLKLRGAVRLYYSKASVQHLVIVAAYLVSMIGKPTAAASAIVPGPALDTNTSEATMYASIFVTNPRPTTVTLPFFSITSSFSARSKAS
jgi:hypothetical protein